MANQGYSNRLAISTTSTLTQGFEFLSFGLRATESPMISEGLRGTRSRISERTRYSNRIVSGPITMQPTPTEMARLLEWILGGTKSGNVYPLADTLSARYVGYESDTSLKSHLFNDVYVNSATFEASEGGPVTLSLDLLGKDVTDVAAGSFGTITQVDEPPFMFYDSTGAFEIAGDVLAIKSFQLSINNNLQASFFNSATATIIQPRDRVITFSCVAELTSSNRTSAYESAKTAVANDIVFTNGGYSLTFAMAALRATKQTLVGSGRSENLLEWSGQACKTGSTLELVATLDNVA